MFAYLTYIQVYPHNNPQKGLNICNKQRIICINTMTIGKGWWLIRKEIMCTIVSNKPIVHRQEHNCIQICDSTSSH